MFETFKIPQQGNTYTSGSFQFHLLLSAAPEQRGNSQDSSLQSCQFLFCVFKNHCKMGARINYSKMQNLKNKHYLPPVYTFDATLREETKIRRVYEK